MRTFLSASALAILVGSFACSAQTTEETDVEESELRTEVSAIFSPQATPENTHTAKIATLIDAARETIDIAIYSYSDAQIGAALGRASERGVKIRFLYDDAGGHSRLDDAERARSASGRLESAGIDVRFVNKILHHKFMIIDGPKSSASRGTRAQLVTGSGNWSNGAATRFDESTIFIRGDKELALRYQREFNLLWDHSRDFVQVDFAEDRAPLDLSATTIRDYASSHVFFTSANFDVRDTTFSLNGGNEVADALVEAIQNATTSIHVASGHLRSRPVSEALMAKRAASPELDIRVYLDGQEYISESSNDWQERNLLECLEGATTDTQRRNCTDRGFLFGYELNLAGIDVRYKYYAYRWDYNYAPQMHNKTMIVDGKTLFTGSYNLSDNAEHGTFENMMRLQGSRYASLVRAFENQFEVMWNAARDDGSLAALTHEIETADEFPIVFAPMSLSWDEITALKETILANCPQIDGTAFRRAAAAHQRCRRPL